MLDHHKTMTTETTTTTTTEPVTETQKANCFLGLYFPKDLKDKVAAAAKNEDRSMSKYAVRVFEKHFAAA
jgi:hypothetical protein